MTPTREFFHILQILQSAAHRGDILAWQLNQPKLNWAAQAAGVNASAYRITLKTMYRNLLKKARARYQRYALYFRKQAQCLRLYDGSNSSEQLLQKARKLENYARSLSGQLQKTAA